MPTAFATLLKKRSLGVSRFGGIVGSSTIAASAEALPRL